MNAKMLAAALRERADRTRSHELGRSGDFDTAMLLSVLARVVEGKPHAKAFGAPGDWGYGTAIGKALAAEPDTTSSPIDMLAALRRLIASNHCLAEISINQVTYYEDSPCKNLECCRRWEELNNALAEAVMAARDTTEVTS